MSYNLEYTYVWYTLQCNYNPDHKVSSRNFDPGNPCPFCIRENPVEGEGTALLPARPNGFRVIPRDQREKTKRKTHQSPKILTLEFPINIPALQNLGAGGP